jgi:hypothetical protein
MHVQIKRRGKWVKTELRLGETYVVKGRQIRPLSLFEAIVFGVYIWR